MELRRFMTDDGNLTVFDTLGKIHDGIRIDAVDHSATGSIGKRERAAGMGIELPPFLPAVTTGDEEIHPLFPPLVA